MKQVSKKIVPIALENKGRGQSYGIRAATCAPVWAYAGGYYQRANCVAHMRIESFAVRVRKAGQQEQSCQGGNAATVQNEEVVQSTSYEKHFEEWCNRHGLTADKVDPAGRKRDTSRIWYELYRDAQDGLASQPWCESVNAWLIDAFFELSDGTPM